ALDAGRDPAQRAEGLTIAAAIATLEYERDGDVERLREAAWAYAGALDCDPTAAAATGGLGSTLRPLARWDEDGAQLDRGVDALRRAVVTAGGDRAVRLNNLGGALSTRWEVSRDPDDLTEAALALDEAVELTPEGSPDLAARLNNLGTVYVRTYQQSE